MGNISREQLGEWLSAYLDNEVSEEQRALIEQLLREDDAAREMHEELRRTIEMVGSLPRHRAPASIIEDIQVYAERSELIGDVAAGSFGPVRRRSPLIPLLSTAAALVLTATGVWYVADLAGTPTPSTQTVAQADKDEDSSDSFEKRSRRRSPAAESAPPAIPASLLASATYEQKLAGGLGVETVRKHTFENETVRLEVTVGSDVERDLMAARLIGQLKKQTAEDLSRRDDGAAEPPAGRFYFEGAPKVNFAEPGQRQVLVRASRHDVEALMEEMSKATTGRKAFALTAGPLSVRGFERARAMITGLEENIPVVAQAGASPATVVADESTVAFDGDAEGTASKGGGATTDFDELLRVVGLSSDAVRKTFAKPPAAVTNEPLALAPPPVVAEEDTSVLAGPEPPKYALLRPEEKEISLSKRSDVAITPAAPVDRVASADSDASRKSKFEGTESLVSRRMRAIDKARLKKAPPEVVHRGEPATEWDGESGGPPPLAGRGGATASETSSDGYVTLVIQVKIEDTKGAAPGPKPAKRSTKPAKDATRQ